MSVGVQCDFCKQFFASGTAKILWTEQDHFSFQFDVCDECAKTGLSLKRVARKGKFLKANHRALEFGFAPEEEK